MCLEKPKQLIIWKRDTSILRSTVEWQIVKYPAYVHSSRWQKKKNERPGQLDHFA